MMAGNHQVHINCGKVSLASLHPEKRLKADQHISTLTSLKDRSAWLTVASFKSLTFTVLHCLARFIHAVSL